MKIEYGIRSPLENEITWVWNDDGKPKAARLHWGTIDPTLTCYERGTDLDGLECWQVISTETFPNPEVSTVPLAIRGFYAAFLHMHARG